MNDTKLTTQQVMRVFRKLHIPFGHWNGSGRVKGWGSWTPGVGIEQRERFDPTGGGMMRGKNGWQRNFDGTPRYRGSWKKDTGIFDIVWHDGDRAREPDPRAAEFIAATVEAFRAQGWTVTPTDNPTTWTLSS